MNIGGSDDNFQAYGSPRFLPVMAVWAVIAHLFLMRAKVTQARWDAALEFVRLRPKSL
jgi:hypothetical protein